MLLEIKVSCTKPVYNLYFQKTVPPPKINFKNEINFSKIESGQNQENLKRFVYTPPQPVHLNKLTQFKPNINNETDV